MQARRDCGVRARRGKCSLPPDEFAQYIRNEIAKWKRLVAEANIKVE